MRLTAWRRRGEAAATTPRKGDFLDQWCFSGVFFPGFTKSCMHSLALGVGWRNKKKECCLWWLLGIVGHVWIHLVSLLVSLLLLVLPPTCAAYFVAVFWSIDTHHPFFP